MATSPFNEATQTATFPNLATSPNNAWHFVLPEYDAAITAGLSPSEASAAASWPKTVNGASGPIVIPDVKVARRLVSTMPQKLKAEDLNAWQAQAHWPIDAAHRTVGACYRVIPESVALERLIDAIMKENSVDDDMMDPVAIKICDGEYTTGAQIKTAVNQRLASLPWSPWRRLQALFDDACAAAVSDERYKVDKAFPFVAKELASYLVTSFPYALHWRDDYRRHFGLPVQAGADFTESERMTMREVNKLRGEERIGQLQEYIGQLRLDWERAGQGAANVEAQHRIFDHSDSD